MISFQQMHYIVVLSEELQFQRASERCFVTQPTLSMQIKKAEETLGSIIFDRSRQPLELTEFGRELLPLLRDTLFEYNKIDSFAKRSKGIYKEEIRMAIIPTVAGYMLPDLYKQWKKLNKDNQLTIEELKTEEILVAMEDRKIDIGILSGPVSSTKLRTIPLYQEEIKAYLPTVPKSTISTEELKEFHPWLLNQGNCLRTQMMDFCELKTKETKADWDYEGGNIRLLEKMVDIHGGYTLVPNYDVQNNSNNYKSIYSANQEVPAREIVAVVAYKNDKWEYLEGLIRTVQLKYAKNNDKPFKLLDWQ